MRIFFTIVALVVWLLIQWAWGNFAYGAMWRFFEAKLGWQEAALSGLFLRYLPPLIPPLIIVVVAGFSFGWWAQLFGIDASENTLESEVRLAGTSSQEYFAKMSSVTLKDRALKLSAQMRQFEASYNQSVSDLRAKAFAGRSRNAPREVGQREFSNYVQLSSQLDSKFKADFTLKYRPEAVALRTEILRRIGSFEAPLDFHVSAFFENGMLIGASPITAITDYLDQLAGKLE